MTAPIAALFDWGGTLCSERVRPLSPEDVELRLERVAALLPASPRHGAARAVERLLAAAQQSDVENSDDPIRMCAEELGLSSALAALRRCFCMPARQHTHLLPAARTLLATTAALGLRCVVVSNSFWRDAAAYRQDFDDFELSTLIHGVISSIDVGCRKPDRRMFEAALASAHCSAVEAIFIGNSEDRDIAPARSMGMRTVRVAIEEARPASSHADAVVTSLKAAGDVLQAWARDRALRGRN